MSRKVKRLEELKSIAQEARSRGEKVVFTNGCFDLLHRGHLHLLREAKKAGDILIVGLNTDNSVRQIKGSNRPVVPELDRAELIAALEMVDYVTLFDEPDPYRLISELRPSVLVKGGDWSKKEIVGAEIVEADGGTIALVPYLSGFSTTQIIERMRT